MQGGGWGAQSPQPMQSPYFQQPGSTPMQQQQQQPMVTQRYGASFDQAQAAAKYAHQQRKYG